jgi:hypothetical protein
MLLALLSVATPTGAPLSEATLSVARPNLVVRSLAQVRLAQVRPVSKVRTLSRTAPAMGPPSLSHLLPAWLRNLQLGSPRLRNPRLTSLRFENLRLKNLRLRWKMVRTGFASP